MTVHQCPKCVLRFTWPTELDDHCRTDHPDFHHDYPVHGVHHNDAAAVAPVVVAETDDEPEVILPPLRPADSASILATYWNER